MEPTIDTCIVALIERISSVEPTTISSAEDKAAFISLYYIFKEQFLFALDLLDQQRIIACTWNTVMLSDATSINNYHIYYILSESKELHETPYYQYEVRTSVWHCSCPEFTFSAYNKMYSLEKKKVMNTYGSYWGGYILGQPVPICKHLLACVLVEHGGSWVRQRIIEKNISQEELILYAIQ